PMTHQLITINRSKAHLQALEEELALAREELIVAEAQLAEEQAAVNRFRMHCRLKIGEWVEDVLDLRSTAQTLLTQLQLQRQAEELGLAFDKDDIFGEADESDTFGQIDNEAILLPTDVPNDKAAEKRLYRELAKKFHPDKASGSAERAYATMMMASINTAYQARDIDTLRDLSGELDPQMVSKLSGGTTPQERRLRKYLLGCQRRLRRVRRQFQAMKQENTARLWRKAMKLEAEGLNWWDEVRDELSAESTRLRSTIDTLNTHLAGKSVVVNGE
ncbi:MAG: J domain-containing protein, partial [Candidatus Promineifilaceae bacterium]